jgi:hypothetical protein
VIGSATVVCVLRYKLCSACQIAIAGKPAPTGIRLIIDSVFNPITVGAGLPAMASSPTPQIYLVGLTVTGALPAFICSSNGAH